MAASPTTNRKLPQYFPLVEPKCSEVATAFFQCFEVHSKMQNNTDTTSCKAALVTCGPQLDAYEQCMSKELEQQAKAKSKPKWKFW